MKPDKKKLLIKKLLIGGSVLFVAIIVAAAIGIGLYFVFKPKDNGDKPFEVSNVQLTFDKSDITKVTVTASMTELSGGDNPNAKATIMISSGTNNYLYTSDDQAISGLDMVVNIDNNTISYTGISIKWKPEYDRTTKWTARVTLTAFGTSVYAVSSAKPIGGNFPSEPLYLKVENETASSFVAFPNSMNYFQYKFID